jgi:hypothetical protein
VDQGRADIFLLKRSRQSEKVLRAQLQLNGVFAWIFREFSWACVAARKVRAKRVASEPSHL